MRFVTNLALVLMALAIAFGGGIASARWMTDAPSPFGRIVIGPWDAFPSAGLPEADPYTRARLALVGELPLGLAEGIAFSARTDSTGAPLRLGCRYRLSGLMPAARWWSLVPQPIAEGEDRPVSLHSRQLLRSADGSFVITASASVEPGNWLALPVRSGATGDQARRALPELRFVVTLYDTPVTREANLGSVMMPDIEPLGCAGGRSDRGDPRG